MPTDSMPGLLHFVAETDSVGRGLFAMLLLMSVWSWYVMLTRLLSDWAQRRRATAFLAAFERARSVDDLRALLDRDAADGPQRRVARGALRAADLHRARSADQPDLAVPPAEHLIREIRQKLDQEAALAESGLTSLATIGATAPFVGLFGTVWGVYHALVAIGRTGSASLDKVAGPVGEALIMTGIGLAVAIPAVIGYNAIIRRNRTTAARLDAFAHDLLTLQTLGALPQGSGSGPARGDAASRAAVVSTQAG